MMVSDAIFIVKFNTRLTTIIKILLKSSGLQILNIDISLDRSIEYLRSEVLFDGPGSHFHSEIQNPA